MHSKSQCHPRLLKEFTDDPVLPGGSVTLEFTLSHADTAAGGATDISFVWLILNDTEAFYIRDDGSILMSFAHVRWIWGVGWVFAGDIVRFVPTSLGSHTAGHFARFLDGSDVGLSKQGESIDAIAFTPDNRLVISTIGNAKVPGASGTIHAKDEDLLVLDNGSFGSSSSGTWEMYFDGSDVGLNTGHEEVSAAWIDPDNGDIYLSTSSSTVIGKRVNETIENSHLLSKRKPEGACC